MLKNSNYINKLIIDPDGLAEKAQVGVDITVKSIDEILGGAIIPSQGKTIHAETQIVDLLKTAEGSRYFLEAGKAYAATMDQGLEKLPANNTAFIMHRSSLNRNGCVVTGSVFDSGYGCKNLGCTLYPTVDIYIENHARIAQLIIHENERVDNLYDGQYSEE